MKAFPILGENLEKNKPSYKNIAIVTMDLVGPIRNGGIGTAYTALAELLASDGHKVTIIFANGFCDEDLNFHLWQKEYKRRGIYLESLIDSPVEVKSALPVRRSYSTYLMLKERHYDIMHFPDLFGIGYFCQLAKKQGLAFLNTTFFVILHGPTEWIHEGNHCLPTTDDELQMLDLEKKSIAMADFLISPSQYAANWALDRGWSLPVNTFVEHYALPASTEVKNTKKQKQFNEIVFFGRIETRKGIDLFCEALELLPLKMLKNIQVTFLGRMGLVEGAPAWNYLEKQMPNWKFKYKFIEDFNQEDAVSYLMSKNCLAVISSRSETLGFTTMECIRIGIPFIASDIPAFRELIRPIDCDSVLFKLDSESLALKISDAFQNGIPTPIKLIVENKISKEHFSKWHMHHVPKKHVAAPLKEAKISICIPHKDRPMYLEQALESLSKQTYTNFEVIISDDGSSSKSALLFLDNLKNEFKTKNWKIIRSTISNGPSSARQKAVEVSTGEYLLFMDDDNLAKSNELETFIKVISETNAEIVTCSFDRFNGDKLNSTTWNLQRWVAHTKDLNQCVFGNPIGDTNSLFKKSTYIKLGGFNSDSETGWEDFNLLMRGVLTNCHIEICPEALFWYRDHANNLSAKTNTFKNLQSRLETFKNIGNLDLRPIVSILLAWHFRNKMNAGPDIQHILVNPSRTNFYNNEGLTKKVLFHMTLDKIKSLQYLGHATAIISKKKYLIFSFDKAKSAILLPKIKSTQLSNTLVLVVNSISEGQLEFSYIKEGSKLPTRVIHNITTGRNYIRVSIIRLALNQRIKLMSINDDLVLSVTHLSLSENE